MATINPTQSPFEPTSTATPFPPSIAPARPVLRAEEDDDEDGARPAGSIGPVVASIVLLFGLAVTAAFAGRGIVGLLSGFITG
ncbi:MULTISPECIES: hypothetical protein [Oerskovia]|uniref:hypothetical protein n=1 Tax=Oerskovia TaxID=162491 RepID=UPI0006FEAE25|nr:MULTISPECIES: hypothetical protein [unclassified Oerskovia]KRC37096.1 hypothetical protein ASE15_08950 [Oerskovia sp. Root22]KRD37344.1 hypothetical protein ASE27_08145 [Oerskovia sp. Root918]